MFGGTFVCFGVIFVYFVVNFVDFRGIYGGCGVICVNFVGIFVVLE